MSNKFVIWIDTPIANTNVQTYENFSTDAQRQNGFAAGQVASSIRMNTVLRQANLVACALMDIVAPDDNTVDFSSDRSAVSALLKSYFDNFTTKINLNGTLVSGTPTFYAPTAAGTSGRFLRSNGANTAPTYEQVKWVDIANRPAALKYKEPSGFDGVYTDGVYRVTFNIDINEYFGDSTFVMYCQLNDSTRHAVFNFHGAQTVDYSDGSGNIRYYSFSPYGPCKGWDSNENTMYVLTGRGAYQSKVIDFTLKKYTFTGTSISTEDLTQYFDLIQYYMITIF